MTTFIHYGFDYVGGVEYQPDVFSILIDNRNKMGFTDKQMLCIHGDAGEIEEQLDDFNWFYFFQPFDGVVMEKCLANIKQSISRRKRDVTIVLINPGTHKLFSEMGFVLYYQFTVTTRQRVVNIYKYLN